MIGHGYLRYRLQTTTMRKGIDVSRCSMTYAVMLNCALQLTQHKTFLVTDTNANRQPNSGGGGRQRSGSDECDERAQSYTERRADGSGKRRALIKQVSARFPRRQRSACHGRRQPDR